jgi:hypothetical protein
MNAVVTITIGKQFRQIARVIHPPMQEYARKIGAEFFVISVPKHSTPLWDKLQLYELCDRFDRIICLDSDVLVMRDCPNLFEVVPDGVLGMYNEGLLTTDEEKAEQARAMDLAVELHNFKGSGNRGHRFYNAGVIVLTSKCHKFIFEQPEKEVEMPYTDQPLYNLRIIKSGIEVQDLTYKFNRMPYVDSKVNEDRIFSHIIHYAGMSPVIQMASFDWARSAPPRQQVGIVPDRLAMLDMLNLSGKICAEIGTYKGDYAEQIYVRDPKELWLIDPWTTQPESIYPDDYANANQNEYEEMYYGALAKYDDDPRVHIIRDFSIHAVNLFPDEYFDFVYVDAIHTLESSLSDMVAWWPKVKKGGWLCGHDYDTWGVKEAVNSFLAILGRQLSFLCREKWTSWGLQK